MKILIAVPTFETITPETFKGIYDIDHCGHEADFDFVKGYDCAKARNVIVREALDGGYDYTLMIDSDVIVPPDTLELFLDSLVPICFGIYPHKNTSKSEAEIFKPETQNYEKRFLYSELTEPRIKVKGAGFGCAFISTEVFRKMPYPHFQYVAHSNGAYLSEDLYFCSIARQMGYELWADTRIRCKHLARYFQGE